MDDNNDGHPHHPITETRMTFKSSSSSSDKKKVKIYLKKMHKVYIMTAIIIIIIIQRILDIFTQEQQENLMYKLCK